MSLMAAARFLCRAALVVAGASPPLPGRRLTHDATIPAIAIRCVSRLFRLGLSSCYDALSRFSRMAREDYVGRFVARSHLSAHAIAIDSGWLRADAAGGAARLSDASAGLSMESRARHKQLLAYAIALMIRLELPRLISQDTAGKPAIPARESRILILAALETRPRCWRHATDVQGRDDTVGVADAYAASAGSDAPASFISLDAESHQCRVRFSRRVSPYTLFLESPPRGITSG